MNWSGALDALRAAGDARKAAIATWLATGEREKVQLALATYRESEDVALVTLANAADQQLYADIRWRRAPERLPDLLSQAATIFLMGDKAKASDYLHQALRHDPTLCEQPVIADFAARLLDMPPEAALAQLTKPYAKFDFKMTHGASHWVRVSALREGADWRAVGRHLALFVVALVLIDLVFRQLFVAGDTLARLPERVLLYAAFGAVSVLLLLARAGGIHVVAETVGGHAPFGRVINRLILLELLWFMLMRVSGVYAYSHLNTVMMQNLVDGGFVSRYPIGGFGLFGVEVPYFAIISGLLYLVALGILIYFTYRLDSDETVLTVAGSFLVVAILEAFLNPVVNAVTGQLALMGG